MELKEFFIFGLIILLLDIPFITYVVAPQYNLSGNLKISYAICAYLVMIASWILIQGDPVKGMLTGFIVYGTYAFTLSAIFLTYKFFPTGLTELTWGTFLFTIATIITNKLT